MTLSHRAYLWKALRFELFLLQELSSFMNSHITEVASRFMQYLSYLNSPECTISFKSAYFLVLKAQEQTGLLPSCLCALFRRPLCKTERLKAGSVDQVETDSPDQLAGSALCLWLLPMS